MDLASRYEGSYSAARYDGEGSYSTDSVKYVGSFKDGLFHGKGALHVTGGKFEGIFDKGRFVSGKFIFEDGLDYEEKDWKYCSEEDPRFYREIEQGVPLDGPLKYSTARANPPKLPAGCYDTIEGYFDPKSGWIRDYGTNREIRKPDADEGLWMAANFRVGK